MIIEGRTHDSADHLSRYLMRAKEGETARVHEMRDTASNDLLATLTDWELCGRTLTKGQKIMYHTHIRLRDGERLNDAQWMNTIEELEQRLGLTNCPRAIVEHSSVSDENEKHFHIAWSRLDAVTERCAPLSWDRKHYHDTARWAEKEFELTPVASLPDWSKGKPNRRQNDAELKAFKERGIIKEHLQAILKYAWESSTTGAEFQDAMRAVGYEIERGDRRDFVVNIDGLKINPVRQLQNAGVDIKAQDFRDLMRGVDVERSGESASDRSKAQPQREGKAAEMPTGKLSQAVSRRKAKDAMRDVIGTASNDEPKEAKPAGFNKTKRRRNSKGPTLKPPGWMRGPF